jgi:hypothetical protein
VFDTPTSPGRLQPPGSLDQDALDHIQVGPVPVTSFDRVPLPRGILELTSLLG